MEEAERLKEEGPAVLLHPSLCSLRIHGSVVLAVTESVRLSFSVFTSSVSRIFPLRPTKYVYSGRTKGKCSRDGGRKGFGAIPKVVRSAFEMAVR